VRARKADKLAVQVHRIVTCFGIISNFFLIHLVSLFLIARWCRNSCLLAGQRNPSV
jgi:hypothetical protein